MTDEFSDRPTGAERVTRLRDQLTTANAHTPAQHVATDNSGFVHVLIGPDGLPEAFEVVAGWERWLAPDEFGTAVEQACRMATIERMVSWSAALDGPGQVGAEHHDAGPGAGPDADRDHDPDVGDIIGNGVIGDSAPEPTATPTAAFDPDAIGPDVQPRPITQLIEELHRLVGQTDQLAGQGAFTAEGASTAGQGTLVLRLSKTGGVSCQADPQWVARQTAAGLMNALGHALAGARAELAQAEREARVPIDQLMRLCAESIAALNQRQRVTSSP